MESIDIIAACMICLTGFAMLVSLVLIAIGIRTFKTLGRAEALLEQVRNESVPILNEGRKVAENMRDLSVMVKHQAGKSEVMVENTLRNIHDMSSRLKESVDTAASVFKLVSRITKALGGK